MISFKQLLQEMDLETNDPDITLDNGIFATIKDEGSYAMNYNEEIELSKSTHSFDDYPTWYNKEHQEKLEKNFPTWHKATQEAHKYINENETHLITHFHTPKNLSKHIHGIRDYTTGNDANNLLWKKYKKENFYDDENINKIRREQIYPLDRALRDNKIPHDIDVYSATRHNPQKLKNKNDIVHHPAYLSTSLDPYVALNRTQHTNTIYDESNDKIYHTHNLIHIKVPKNHSGFYTGNESQFSPYKERELILPRNLKLKHNKTESYTNHLEHNTDLILNIHHMSLER